MLARDPFLYTDVRGNFHLLYHVYTTEPANTCTNSTVSAHVFSETGLSGSWHSHPTSPYGTHVQLTDGTEVVVSTRERPKLFFNETGESTLSRAWLSLASVQSLVLYTTSCRA